MAKEQIYNITHWEQLLKTPIRVLAIHSLMFYIEKSHA